MATLFCGIDFHKRTCTLHTVDQNGKQVDKTKRISTDRLLIEMKNLKQAVVGIESSGGVNRVADQIRELGHDVRIINSNKARAIGFGGKKTDAKDAEMIANLLRSDFAPEVALRGQSARDMSMLITAREHLVATRTSTINHVRGLLREYGLTMNTGVDSFMNEVTMQISMLAKQNPQLAKILGFKVDMIKQCTSEIRSIETQIEKATVESESIQNLRSVPGIGLLGAFLMVAVVDDISRFPDAKSFASYLGLVPRENSSGDNRRLGAITKSGNETLRRYLIHGARALLNSKRFGKDPNFLWGKRIEAKKGSNKATVALAHKLARIAFAVLRDSSSYQSKGRVAVSSEAA